jgi:hypothetical protein
MTTSVIMALVLWAMIFVLISAFNVGTKIDTSPRPAITCWRIERGQFCRRDSQTKELLVLISRRTHWPKGLSEPWRVYLAKEGRGGHLVPLNYSCLGDALAVANQWLGLRYNIS